MPKGVRCEKCGTAKNTAVISITTTLDRCLCPKCANGVNTAAMDIVSRVRRIDDQVMRTFRKTHGARRITT